MNIDEIAKWHHGQQCVNEETKAWALGAARMGNEDAGIFAESYGKTAAMHASMATTLDVYIQEFRQ